MKNSEIIADKAHPYSLEVISHIGENTFTYDPSSLSWSIEDPTVCKIENGILTGIKNGTTNITGSIGNFSGNMKVTVEIPESPKSRPTIFPAGLQNPSAPSPMPPLLLRGTIRPYWDSLTKPDDSHT